MKIDPISEDLINQSQENINVSHPEIPNQPQDQRFVNKTIANESIAPVLGPSNNTNDFLTINTVNNKEITEEKKIRNEQIAINVFAVLGIIASSIYLTNLLLTTANMKALSTNSFFIVCDFLLFIFILRKNDIARKIAVFFGYLILAFCLIMIILAGFHSKIISGFVPNIIFAIFVICFLSLERIKRHFA